MNISDSIGSFSDLYKKGLIKKEQFEAKIIDIVKSDVSGGIALKAVEEYLLFFKKMSDGGQIDDKLYGEISDLLLAKCEISEKPQNKLANRSGHSETLKHIKDKNSEARDNLKARADLSLESGKTDKTGDSTDVDSALIVEEVKPDTQQTEPSTYTQQQTKANVVQTEKSGMGNGAKIALSICVVFAGSIIMGLIYEFRGHGIFHGIAGIATVWFLFDIWKR